MSAGATSAGVGPGRHPTTRALELVTAALVPMSREQPELAAPLLREALALDPADANARALLGTALVALGDPEGGRALIDDAVGAAPHAFLPRLKGGEMALRLGDLAGAEEHLIAALRAARPGSADAGAARTLLAEVRQRSHRSIAHHASLPGWWVRAGRALAGSRRRSVETGSIPAIEVEEISSTAG